jgi:phosphoribosylpyrophosphate synthetase
MSEAVLIAGNGNRKLAHAVAARLGTSICEGDVKTFADGEINVSFANKSV